MLSPPLEELFFGRAFADSHKTEECQRRRLGSRDLKTPMKAYEVQPGHVSLEQRCLKLCTLAMEYFRRLGGSRYDLVD